ncbi:MAG: hypothetical protein GC150_13600 [Rhizobiales bacterium]|nr:hypothetical protein [Hyphomicrobiales bacterium]
MAAAIAIWLAIATWSATDPSLHGGPSELAHNLLGAPGALVADLLFQTLGLAAVLFVLPIATWGHDLYRRKHVRNLPRKLILWPVGTGLLAAAFSGLPRLEAWPLHHGFGGLAGDTAALAMTGLAVTVDPTFGPIAAGLLMAWAGAAIYVRAFGIQLQDLRRAFEPSDDTLERPRGLAMVAGLALASLAPLAWVLRPRFRSAAPAAAGRGASGIGGLTAAADAALAAGAEFGAATAASARPGGPSGRDAGARSEPRFSDVPSPSELDDPSNALAGAAVAGGVFAGAAMLGGVGSSRHTSNSLDERGRDLARRFAPASRTTSPTLPINDAPLADPVLVEALSAAAATPANDHRLPSIQLLAKGRGAKLGAEFTQSVLRGNSRLLEDVLKDYGIKGSIVNVRPGPVVTLYELEPQRGVKASRVIGLSDDIARSMSVAVARVATVPGRNAIGIELPNVRREPVVLREMFESKSFRHTDAALPIALGRAIDGEPVVVDLAQMPHLLVAGTTGSGKSVGLNAMILSLLYRLTPDACRLLLIDPKMLELSAYNGIPHLLCPVVTDARVAVSALQWAVGEMEERYKRMASLGVRNIKVYNNRIAHARRMGRALNRTVQVGFDRADGQPVFENENLDLEAMPYIVIVIDEMADLVLTAGKEFEAAVQRLAQMARAAGIHLVAATQRPSVDVVTGVIKANLPSRLSFKVASAADSRTVLGQQGAEQLLGAGDMLFSAGGGEFVRLHGPFVGEEEIEAVTSFLASQGEARYVPALLAATAPASSGTAGAVERADDLYDRAVAMVLRDGRVSTSYLQRRLSIGYGRASTLVQQMEQAGLVTGPNAAGRREVLGHAP